MNEDVKIFACLAVGRGLIEAPMARRLGRVVGQEASLDDFVQKIVDLNLTEDREAVKELRETTADMLKNGEKAPFDPFRAPAKKASGGVPLPEQRKPAASQAPLPQPEPAPEASQPEEEPRKIRLKRPGEESPAPAPPEEPAAERSAPPAADRGAGSANPAASAEASAGGDDLQSAVNDVLAMFKKGSAKKSTGEAPAKREEGGVSAEDVKALASNLRGAQSRAGQAAQGAPQAAAAPKVQREKPRETVVPARGISPAWPDLNALESTSPEEARKTMIAFLLAAAAHGASDLHVSAGARPFFRKNRQVEYIGDQVVSRKAATALNLSILSKEQRQYFQENQDYDFALAFDTGQRFRSNLMIHKEGIQGAFRIVPAKVPSLKELGFHNHDKIEELLAYHNGLLMVTGPVGSGKTTTLAALVAHLNKMREDHIICVEEPLEVVQQSERCQITQRGVGPHTRTFKSALKGALRQDPDIIVIGEMRDLETIEMAISASETGHLVIGTMHTSDAGTTLNRLLDVFPPAQQGQIRAMVAESLRGILCQRLLPAANGGTVLGVELLLKNSAVTALIKEGKSQGLGNIMETGRAEGMVTMDSWVLELFRQGKISAETALENIKNESLRQQVRTGGGGAAPPPVQGKKGGLFR